jgi:hypothetical protein
MDYLDPIIVANDRIFPIVPTHNRSIQFDRDALRGQ